jgi:hypothetical protein
MEKNSVQTGYQLEAKIFNNTNIETKCTKKEILTNKQ